MVVLYDYTHIDAEHLRVQRTRVAADYLQRTLFVLPRNDGEAVRALQILRALSAPHVYCSAQGWGAVLEKEMPVLRARLTAKLAAVCILEIPGCELDSRGIVKCEQELRDRGLTVDIIDHHFYHWSDRSHQQSSLEQLCVKINWQLDTRDQHIAVNDRAWVPGLLALGLTAAEIRAIRDFDLRCQGHAAQTLATHTAAAQRYLDAGQVQAQDGVFVLLPQGINTAVLAQELALRHDMGIVNIFVGRKRSFYFSGCTAAAVALQKLDYRTLGYPTPHVVYGGGEARFSKFFGLKSKHAIDPACHEYVLQKIRAYLP